MLHVAIFCLIIFLASNARWAAEAICEAKRSNATDPQNVRNQHLISNLGGRNSSQSFTYRVPLTAGETLVECVQRLVLIESEEFDYIMNFQLLAKSWKQAASFGLLHLGQQLTVLYANPDTGEQTLVRPMSGISGNHDKAIFWSVVANPSHLAGARTVRQTIRMALSTEGLSEANIKVNALRLLVPLSFSQPLFSLQIIFTMVVPCTHSAFRCNHYICIDGALLCDGDRNCPQMLANDEGSCGTQTLVLLIVCFSIFVLVILTIFAIQLCAHRRPARLGIGPPSPQTREQPQPLSAEMSSSFLPRSPPPYDRRTKNARPSGHDLPPSYSESKGPAVSAPKPQSAVDRFGPKFALESSAPKILEE